MKSNGRVITYCVNEWHPFEIEVALHHLDPFLTTRDALPILHGSLVDEISIDTPDVERAFHSNCKRRLTEGWVGFGLSNGGAGWQSLRSVLRRQRVGAEMA